MEFKFNYKIQRYLKCERLTRIEKIQNVSSQDLKIQELKVGFCYSNIIYCCPFPLHVIKSYGLYGANAEKHSSTRFVGADFILEQGHWCHRGCRSVASQHPLSQEEPSRYERFLARVQES